VRDDLDEWPERSKLSNLVVMTFKENERKCKKNVCYNLKKRTSLIPNENQHNSFFFPTTSPLILSLYTLFCLFFGV
jgi:hypothetical protein